MFFQRASAWLARRRHSRRETARRARAMHEAWQLPQHPIAVTFAGADAPLVSIVVPVFEHWPYSNACLRALAATHDPSIPTEILIVDDASSDRTAELLAACRGIRTIRLERNGGFAAACNAGAAAARGTYLHFLNNDTVVAEGWLRPLLETFQSGDRIGAVASQLRYPGGTLAEAGGVIWRDGRGSNYGRGESSRDWRFASVRDVDYGSAASLMVRADAFAEIGGFSAEYSPAYYEDVDLAFALRARAYRVVYQPRSVVSHAEGVSYGSNSSAEARALQERNRVAFAAKWADELREYLEPDAANLERAARRLAGAKTILIVDSHVPFTDRDAGSRRIRFLMDLLRERGWHVLFGSVDAVEHEPYAGELRANGIELIAGFDAASLAMLASRNFGIDAVWLCRPDLATALLPASRANFDAKIVFDTVDLHFLRLEREQRVLGRPTGWEAMRERELAVARAADLTITVSEAERALLATSGIAPVAVIPVIEPAPRGGAPGWAARSGVIFLGNYAHAPNVDAATWLCEAIMPLVWERLPGLKLTLAGADPTRAVRALAQPNVTVTGYVADPAVLLATARVFAAPLRFGAGVKGKIVHALAHGVPVVTTPIGGEGIFAGSEYGEAASAPELAAQIVRLHEDRTSWEERAESGRAIAARFTPSAVAKQLEAALAMLYAG